MRNDLLKLSCLISFLAWLPICQVVRADTEQIKMEKQFKYLVSTAGYSTGLGAALGVAIMGLTANPMSKSYLVAKGASLGFIVGTGLGAYMIVEKERRGSFYTPSSHRGYSSDPIYEGSQNKRKKYNQLPKQNELSQVSLSLLPDTSSLWADSGAVSLTLTADFF